TIGEVIDRAIEIGKRTNPSIHCIGISANTSKLSGPEAKQFLENLEKEFGVPAVDPMRFGMAGITNSIKGI
ncbi:MAG: DUF1611 domain-containing protein, partial [Aquiluna sp.]